MTNEELAIKASDGDTSAVGKLYEQNSGIIFKYAKSFYVLHSERCTSCGVTFDDIMNECFFAVRKAAFSWAKSEKKFKFTSYLRYAIQCCLLEMVGLRTASKRNDPLNNCKSIDTPIEGTDDLTFIDTIEDITETEKAERRIEIIALENVFPEAKKILSDKPKEYDIIYSLYHDNMYMSELGRRYGVSTNRIYLQKISALRKLRNESDKLKSIYSDVVGVSYKHGGLTQFKNTNTSSVEWAVIEAERMKNETAAD